MKQSISFEQYSEMPVADRAAHLNANIKDNFCLLREQFLLEAIRFERNPLAKWFIIKGLGILRSTDSLNYIIETCREPEAEWGHTSLHSICAWSLGRIGEGAFGEVMRLLSEPSVETRRCAVDALGELRLSKAVNALCFSLECEEHVVQLWAGLSLAKIGKPAVPHLEHILMRCGFRTRLIVLDALIKIADGDSFRILEQVWSKCSVKEREFIQGRLGWQPISESCLSDEFSERRNGTAL